MKISKVPRARSKTSIDIMQERDELDIRLRRIDRDLIFIEDEIEHALHHPEIALHAICRIAALVKRARLERSARARAERSGTSAVGAHEVRSHARGTEGSARRDVEEEEEPRRSNTRLVDPNESGIRRQSTVA